MVVCKGSRFVGAGRERERKGGFVVPISLSAEWLDLDYVCWIFDGIGFSGLDVHVCIYLYSGFCGVLWIGWCVWLVV